MNPTPSPASTPSRPRLVLRVGFAGRKELSADEETRLSTALRDVLQTLGGRLAAIAPGVPLGADSKPRVSKFFAAQCPLLRLVTGLCEGADAVAAQVLEQAIPTAATGTASAQAPPCLETELAAVLPFDVETYRRSRPAAFQAVFDNQLTRCAWVLTLDGIYEKPDPDTVLAKSRRARAYRAQSAFLLRHSDLLIAAATPDDSGRAGGTLETVREAQVFDLPVVFIHTGTGDVYLIAPEDDLHSVLAEEAPAPAQWQATLQNWVTQITADPDSGLHPGGHEQDEQAQHGEELLTEFFDRPACPPCDAAGQRQASPRERVWTWFEERFRSAPDAAPDPGLQPYGAYRKRATGLNYHYSGLYRGAFLLNYALAIVAVALAAASLALLGTALHTALVEPVATVLKQAGHIPADTAVSPTAPAWLLPVLLGFAVVKLGLLGFISRNTRRANRERWNDRAVDYRYLAERLRGMYYLPLAGSHQPPAAAPPQFASRVVRQSAVDWLFDALVRTISPADLAAAQSAEIPAYDGRGRVRVQRLLILQPAATVIKVRDAWIGEQAKYHERNARTMHALHHTAETAGLCFGWTVIAVVAFDLFLIGGKVLHWLPEGWVPFAKAATPWLIFVSAVLPAVVAALGGIRFQSECQRLAERSAVMRVMLAGRKQSEPKLKPEARWRRAWVWLTAFGSTTWLVLRHLFGCAPKVPPVEFVGGRWELADKLARRLANSQAAPASDPGSWAHDTLRLTERVATDFVQEAAEWSVLYAKELSDPG